MNLVIEEKNYICLDFLRGFSGYGVAITHFFAFIYDSQFFEYLSYLFVEFFFILSGFVLAPQILRVFKNKKNLMIFYKRRWIRTLPLYFLFLFLISFIFNKIGTEDFFKYFFFIQDFFPNYLKNNYYPIVWSLSVEEFFYLLFPLIIIFFNKNLCIKKLFIFFLVIYFLKLLFYNIFDLEFLRKNTFFRFDAILLGFLIRLTYIKINYHLSIIIFVISLIIFLFLKEFFLAESSFFYIKFFFIILLQIISMNFLICLIKFEFLFNKKYINSICKLISKQTYSIYLSHMILIYFLVEKNINTISMLLFYLLLLFVLSYFTYYYIEKPLLEKRPKYL